MTTEENDYICRVYRGEGPALLGYWTYNNEEKSTEVYWVSEEGLAYLLGKTSVPFVNNELNPILTNWCLDLIFLEEKERLG